MAKRYQQRDKAHFINEIYATEAISALRRKEYEEERYAYNNSKKGQFEQEVRNSIQAITREEDKAYNTYLSAMVKLKETIYDLIGKYLSMKYDNISDASIEDIEQSLKATSVALTKMKKMCKSEQYLERFNPKNLNEYEKLFNLLVDKLDVRFALFAPKRCLNRRTIRFYKMPVELRDELFDRLEEFGLTQNLDYVEAYADVFENQIKAKGIEL